METSRIAANLTRDQQEQPDDDDDVPIRYASDDNNNNKNLSSFLSWTTWKECAQNIKSHWKIVAFGQLLSFLLSSAGATQSALSFHCHLSAPTFTVGLYYAGLACFLIPLYIQRRRRRYPQRGEHQRIAIAEDEEVEEETVLQGEMLRISSIPMTEESSSVIIAESGPLYSFLSILPLEAPPWFYACLAVMDVYASYTTVLAFRYTTLTSATLLTSLAIPSAVILSLIFLKRRYTCIHVMGLCLCIAGIAINVMQDVHDDLGLDFLIPCRTSMKLKSHPFRF